MAEEQAPEEAGEGGIVVGQPAEPASTETADVVVVGSGIGGFFASMIAKEQAPDATVIMLEKNGWLGGSTNLRRVQRPRVATRPTT